MLNVSCLPLGVFQANCYLIRKADHVLIVDPGARAEKVIRNIGENELVDGIVLTHGHFDHIGAVDDLIKHYGCRCWLHHEDHCIAKDRERNSMQGIGASIYHPLEDLKEGDFKVGVFDMKVMKAPGHTPGSCLIQMENVLFSGDVLFYMSIGRTDLPLGSERDMKDSLRFITTLDRELIVYPGHGESTTIGFELDHNPWL